MDHLRDRVEQARTAQRQLLMASAESRTTALRELSTLLTARTEEILAANQRDLDAAYDSGLDRVLLHRLELNTAKLDGMIQGVKSIAERPDPVGVTHQATELDVGLELQQVTSPLGVLLIIFESRPDAVIQIGALTLRTSNAVVLKGGREARHSNRILTDCLREALSAAHLPPDGVTGIEDREEVSALLGMDDAIDLVIPRGSNQLVRTIQEGTRIPVLGHADGICHIYLAEKADPVIAAHVVLDAKTSYPSACNAVETLLVDQHFLPNLPKVLQPLIASQVELRADAECANILKQHHISFTPAQSSDYGYEFGDRILALKTVSGMDAAIEHIHTFGSAHTEAILTEDKEQAEKFLQQVDAASVFHNASTRFADGFRYGLGAEVGISTARIHARGPVGIDGLLTSRWILRGNGQAASDYGPGKKRFTHRQVPE